MSKVYAEFEESGFATFDDLKESVYLDSMEDEKVLSGSYGDKIWEVWQRKNGWYDAMIKDKHGSVETSSTCKTPHEYIKWFADHDINIYDKRNSSIHPLESLLKQGAMSAVDLVLYCLNDWDYYAMSTFMDMEAEGIIESVGEEGQEMTKFKVGDKIISMSEPPEGQFQSYNEKGLYNWMWEIKSSIKEADVNGVSTVDKVVEWLNNFTPENEEKFKNLIEEGLVEDVTEYPQLYDELVFKVEEFYVRPVGKNEKGLDGFGWQKGNLVEVGNKVEGMKHRPRDVYLPGNAHLIASWETRGGRYFFDLYETNNGYTYNAPAGLGSLGASDKEDAINKMQEVVGQAKELDGITYRRVL